MNTALAVIALSSLATTCLLLAYVVRLRRDDRARSDARVAALAAAAGKLPDMSDGPAAVLRDSPSMPQAETRGASSASPVDNVFTTQSLFADQPSPGRVHEDEWRRWSAAAAVMAIVLAAAAVALTAGADRQGSTHPAAESAPAPLELLSLGHERRDALLVVRGSVRVPLDLESARIDVLVLVFDRGGQPLDSVRTAATPLRPAEPGAAAPVSPAQAFSASIPDAAGVGRYRVRFQQGDRILHHIDRRTAGGSLSARR